MILIHSVKQKTVQESNIKYLIQVLPLNLQNNERNQSGVIKQTSNLLTVIWDHYFDWKKQKMKWP